MSDSTVAPYRQEVIDGLREFADFLESNPEAGIPDRGALRIHEAAMGRDGLVRRARDLGGRWEKVEDDKFFNLVRRFGPALQYELFVWREQVCERIVVGTEEVETTGPDPELVAQVPLVTRVEKVEKVEWKCPDSLLAAPSEVTA